MESNTTRQFLFRVIFESCNNTSDEPVSMVCRNQVCADIQETVRSYFFASGAVIIVLLVLVLVLLLVILCMRIKINSLRKRVQVVSDVALSGDEEDATQGLRESLGTPHGELSPLAVPEGSIVESDAAKIEQAAGSKGCSGGEEAVKVALDSIEEEKPGLVGRSAPTVNAVAEASLDKSKVPDYETVGNRTLAQLASKPHLLADYSSIDDILSILPRETSERNLNVFIVTNDATGFNVPGKPKGTVSEDTTAPKKKAIPIYSVVNKTRRKDSVNDTEVSKSEFSVVDGNPSTKGVSQDVQEKDALPVVDSAPPPPIPPRMYVMSELDTAAQPGGEDSSTIKTSEMTAGLTEESTVPAELNIELMSKECSALETDSTVQKGVFTIQTSSDTRRNSYETVDLVMPKLTLEGEGKETCM